MSTGDCVCSGQKRKLLHEPGDEVEPAEEVKKMVDYSCTDSKAMTAIVDSKPLIANLILNKSISDSNTNINEKQTFQRIGGKR